MTQEILDISPLKKALAQLKQSYDFMVKAKGGKDALYYPQFRSATIQAYEYTYELSIKMMGRFVEMYGATEEEPPRRFTDFVRIMAEYKIIDNPLAWEEFRNNRNKTSHGYDEDVAEQVVAGVSGLITAAEIVVANLETQINAPHS